MKMQQSSQSKLTEAGLVVLIWIREVKVPISLSVVEFHGDGVMCLLVDSPDSASQIQA